MNLAAVVERLRDHAPAFERRVAGVAELDRAIDQTEERFDPPAAYVLPTGAAGELTRAAETFSVVVMLNATPDQRGQAALEQLDAIRLEVRLALTSWSPDAVHEPVVYAGEDLLELARNALWYSFGFAVVRNFGGLISYDVTVNALVNTTSTPAAVLGEFASAIEGVTQAVRLPSDLLDQLPVLLPGDLRYQLVGAGREAESDSNDTRDSLAANLRMHKRLLETDTERSYTEGLMATHQAALLVPKLWRTAGVYDVASVDPGEISRS